MGWNCPTYDTQVEAIMCEKPRVRYYHQLISDTWEVTERGPREKQDHGGSDALYQAAGEKQKTHAEEVLSALSQLKTRLLAFTPPSYCACRALRWIHG